MARLTRQGLPAGLSALLAVGAGLLTNLLTSGWSWPLAIAFAVLIGVYVGYEIWRASRDDAGGPAAPPAGAPTPQRRSVVPPWGLLPAKMHGRDEVLRTLSAVLDPGVAHEAQLHVLCGLGGSGKTTVALSTADAARRSGALVWWISARDETSLVSSLIDLAAELATPEETAQARVGVRSLTDLVWRHIEARTDRWLLVVDNADRPELLAPDGGQVSHGNGVVRPASGGLVLVTSRVGNAEVWGNRAVLHPLGRLSSDASARVLLDAAGAAAGSDGDAVALGERLGGLPLALRAAGRYLSSTAARLDGVTTFAEYRRLLEERFTTLLGRPSAEPREAVVSTWELTLDLLAEQGDDAARKIMRLFGGLAPEPVPIAMLDQSVLDRSLLFGRPARGWLPSWASGRHRPVYDPQAHSRVLSDLCDFGLLDRTTPASGPAPAVPCLVAHPLVAETNARMVRDDAKLGREVRGTVAALLTQASRRYDPEDPSTSLWWALLAPHAEQAVDVTPGHRGSRRELRLLIRALCTVSRGLCGAGDYLTAHVLAERARQVAAHNLTADDPAALVARCHVADAVAHLGDYATALEEYREVLTVQRQRLKRDHPDALRTRRELAWLQALRGMYTEAEAGYRELLDLQRHRLGAEHPDALRSQSDLAFVLAFQDRFDEAEQEYRDVLARQRRVLGDGHGNTIRTRHYRAHALASAGRFEEAEQELRLVYEARTAQRGPKHPDAVRTRQELGWVAAIQGRYEDAEEHWRAVLDVLRDTVGADHVDTLRTRHDLAAIAAVRGRYAEAQRELPLIVEQRRRLLGPEHPATLRARRNLAWLNAELGDDAAAEAELRTILAVWRRTSGPSSAEARLTEAHIEALPKHRRPGEPRPPLWATGYQTAAPDRTEA
ncbi:ATP-binding protein [Paractinoplanes toevensis]|uniref:ATP-binding protein n=1 Tax=Paractinoplanes toevensis TaxID=571911 RepID=A0A919W9A2_9ACTN|nr:ATP-binding protein [Actinoplanes toevensis]